MPETLSGVNCDEKNSNHDTSIANSQTDGLGRADMSMVKKEKDKDASISMRNPLEEEKYMSFPEACEKVHAKVETFLNREPKNERVKAVQLQTRRSLGVIGEALERYSLEELSLSYNGGKDCLVLLILYLTALHTRYGSSSTNNSTVNHDSQNTQLPDKLSSVFILSKHPFKEVDDFVNFSVTKYHLHLTRYAKPMREAFTDYLVDSPRIKGIFVGTRRTDPHGQNLTAFDPTDRNWPSFMRIHPVIDWHYAEIWTFIRELGVEYCGLYDLGYTSLGGTMDTHPNPALAVKEGGDEGEQGRWAGEVREFRPAYELLEDGEERLGRDR